MFLRHDFHLPALDLCLFSAHTHRSCLLFMCVGSLTECCWNTNDEALAGRELLGEGDLLVRSALEELDVGDGVAYLDHSEGIGEMDDREV